VARIVHVADPADPRLADYTRLKDVNLRKSLEAEQGLFVAEGEKVIRRAAAAGYPLRSLLLTRRRAAALADLAETVPAGAETCPETSPGASGVTSGVTSAVPVYLVPDEVAEQLTGFDVHRGALACFGRLPLPAAGPLIASARRLLVLEDLVDPGNVGAVFRCAAALGIEAVILSPRCADPLYRRAVKVSMGAVLAVPYARMSDWYGGLGEIRAAGFRVLALTPDQAATPIGEVPMAGRVAVVLGGEGDGLSPRWLRAADQAVCVPMSGEAMERGVDSLNVVAAAAIACHALGNR
jgi:tRNA G18 (ribose-2'-O)-methylase SpoU